MGDQLKAVFDDINGGGKWDQTTYPATIRIWEPKWVRRDIALPILIEIKPGSIPNKHLQTALVPREEKNSVYVYIEYTNPQNTFAENWNYLKVTLIDGELIPLLTSYRIEFQEPQIEDGIARMEIEVIVYDVVTS